MATAFFCPTRTTSRLVTGCANRSPTTADAIENEVQEALAICGGDAIATLRITLIANAFLEAEIDRLSAAVSSGFARGKVRKAPRRVVNLIGFAGLAMYCRNAAIR